MWFRGHAFIVYGIILLWRTVVVYVMGVCGTYTGVVFRKTLFYCCYFIGCNPRHFSTFWSSAGGFFWGWELMLDSQYEEGK